MVMELPLSDRCHCGAYNLVLGVTVLFQLPVVLPEEVMHFSKARHSQQPVQPGTQTWGGLVRPGDCACDGEA